MDPQEFARLIPLLAPLAILQLGLMIAALVDLCRQPSTRGPKWVWLLVVLLFGFLGPLAYFLLGREET